MAEISAVCGGESGPDRGAHAQQEDLECRRWLGRLHPVDGNKAGTGHEKETSQIRKKRGKQRQIKYLKGGGRSYRRLGKPRTRGSREAVVTRYGRHTKEETRAIS